MPPVEPKPAASVLLVRQAPPDAAEPLEVYMIRRHRGMRFLGGYYAFPGGKVDPADAAPDSLARCRGLSRPDAESIFSGDASVPAFAYWVTAVRELLEESGLLLACDENGRAIDGANPAVTHAIERVRKALMAEEAPFAELMARERLCCDLRPLRYLSHFVTPSSSPIRFSARFFLCPLPEGQMPRLFTEEASEGFWIGPAEGCRRACAREMAMAGPAEFGLGYLAQFESLDDVWAAHTEQHERFCGLFERDDQLWARFDWKNNRWR